MRSETAKVRAMVHKDTSPFPCSGVATATDVNSCMDRRCLEGHTESTSLYVSLRLNRLLFFRNAMSIASFALFAPQEPSLLSLPLRQTQCLVGSFEVHCNWLRSYMTSTFAVFPPCVFFYNTSDPPKKTRSCCSCVCYLLSKVFVLLFHTCVGFDGLFDFVAPMRARVSKY